MTYAVQIRTVILKSRVENLKKMGAKTQKSIPENILTRAGKDEN